MPDLLREPGDDAPDDALAALLRRAFEEAPPPPATPELEDADATTRATVAWMQAAWAQLGRAIAAPVSTPSRAGRAARQSSWADARPPRAWRRAAAAALLLGGLAVLLEQHEQRPATRGESALAPLADAGSPPAPADDRPRVVAVAADHIETRSGAVRLLLLTRRATPHAPPPP